MSLVMPPWLWMQGDDLRLEVLVSPRSARNRIMGVHDERLKIQLAATPVDGKANDALIRFVAETVGIARAQIEIVGGLSSKRKVLRLVGVTAQRVVLKLSPLSG